MPAKWFICPDNERIEINRCLSPGGCRMENRCATQSLLALMGFDRQWQGVSPSSAGNGPRSLYLRAITEYAVNPQGRIWAALGTGVHANIGHDRHNDNVLAETPLSDEHMKGTADCLEQDEAKTGFYVLTDHKTWGSFKVAKALGLKNEQVEETLLDEDGKPLLLKTGPNKGQPKTRKITTLTHYEPDMRDVELQLNRYRLLFEEKGFPVSRMQIQAIVRDGGTYMAKNRGINLNLYLIPVKRLQNAAVMAFYKDLAAEVTEAFRTGYARKCSIWENWERRKCEEYCEVVEACKAMSAKHNEKWGII